MTLFYEAESLRLKYESEYYTVAEKKEFFENFLDENANSPQPNWNLAFKARSYVKSLEFESELLQDAKDELESFSLEP